MSILTKYLGFGTEKNADVREAVETVETTSEFLEKVAEKLPDVIAKAKDAADGFPALAKVIETSAPWLTATAEAAGEALPPVKAILSIVQFLTRETDPYALGLLAVSVAYQASLADAAKELTRDGTLRTPIHSKVIDPKELKRLCSEVLGAVEGPEDFVGFQPETALSHNLVRRASDGLDTILSTAGYPEKIRLALLEGVHARFVEKFRLTISDGKIKDKFEPLFKLMELSGREAITYSFLRRHIKYQLWRFNHTPVFGKGGSFSMPATLEQIFTPQDCDRRPWGEIRRSRSALTPNRGRSPADGVGKRQPLLGAVIELIRDPLFKDAIVVQGTAGSGKSAFTLELCRELRDMALRPIRVRMRDLSLDPRISLIDDVAQALALNCGDEEFDKTMGRCAPSSALDLANILAESIQFENVRMSPYVIILDGWDEISISASEGFQVRIAKTLDAVRREMLNRHSHRVRVVLTGRPSEDVNEAKFLRDETPVLTVLPFTEPQLRGFVERLTTYRKGLEPENPVPEATLRRIDALVTQFVQDQRSKDAREENILGLPLLALLAIWLVLNDEKAPDDLAVQRSSLYRRLVDLTTRHGGNLEWGGPGTLRLSGVELRDLLQRTAAAMSIRGTEDISYKELGLRLEAGGAAEPETVVGRAIAENKIYQLMVSFFFNTGQHDQGCAFIHKSFREYLFAEAIVEALKRNAAIEGNLQPRSSYWRDFNDDDPCGGLADELGLLLAPHWLQPEVWQHLAWLIEWEVSRSTVVAGGAGASEDESTALSLQAWELMRDRLVAMWDWWAEGVHMRRQPYRERGEDRIEYELPHVMRLAEKIAPKTLVDGRLPEPVRLTTLDAHLGDALLRLNCTLHFLINKATGWLDRPKHLAGAALAASLWRGAEVGVKSRRYQTCITEGGRTWWAFAPSSPDGLNYYFEFYMSRINAAGWYPGWGGVCPSGGNFSGVDFDDASLSGLTFAQVTFRYARLNDVNFGWSWLWKCDFTVASACGTLFSSARLVDPERLEDALLASADFTNSLIIGSPPLAKLHQLEGAILVSGTDDSVHRISSSRGKGEDQEADGEPPELEP